MPKKNTFVLPFTKMQGLGNDMIMVDGENLLACKEGKELLASWAYSGPKITKFLCQRHFAIGADGLIVVFDLRNAQAHKAASSIYGSISPECTLAWLHINNDGSIPQICGNGLRCFGLWAYDHGLIDRQFSVWTEVGPLSVVFENEDSIISDLGEPLLESQDIPFIGESKGKKVIKYPLAVGKEQLTISAVKVGNPHCAIFEHPLFSEIDCQLPLIEENSGFFPEPLAKLAKEIQTHPSFPESTNVAFALVQDREHMRALIWERGCGPTLACGSGAAGLLVAGVLEERLARNIEIILPGGKLRVEWSDQDNHVRLIGPARKVYSGEITLDLNMFLAPAQACSSGVVSS